MFRRTTATPDKTVKFGDGKKRETPVTKENGERRLSEIRNKTLATK
jgi:hypothetical protein